MKNSLMLLEKQEYADPRIDLGPQALALAQHNAFPIVAQRTVRKDGMGAALGLAGALVLGGLTFWSMSGHRQAPPPKSVVGTLATPATRPVQVGIPPQSITQVPGAAPTVSPLPPGQSVPSAPLTQTVVPDRPTSPTLVVDNGPAISGQTAIAGNLSGDEAFSARVGASSPEIAAATRMKTPGYTVSQGTLIPAVLETAINSDLPGYVRAVVSDDVKSFDGSRVLVPRSSRLIGQYKSGVAGGQTRAYVLWTRLLRPDGVSVALASPAVDESGQTGLTGSVDDHFMKRFGSALLLSVVGTASAFTTGGTSLVLSGGESAASVAARRDGQIPPTIKVRQGQPIRVFTAKDLDFSVLSGERR
jgi:type IV secretion system protein VirB10